MENDHDVHGNSLIRGSINQMDFGTGTNKSGSLNADLDENDDHITTDKYSKKTGSFRAP
jgi:hypothetical protein